MGGQLGGRAAGRGGGYLREPLRGEATLRIEERGRHGWRPQYTIAPKGVEGRR